MQPIACTTIALLLAGIAWGRDERPSKPPSPESLHAEIRALQAPRVAWRGIAWKSCLLDGLAASRAQRKPVLLWVFIDRPADDARC
jgi:hypothetical protein